MASQMDKYTILYGRLSQEDARLGDSNSILNQRSLLEKYSQDNGFENTLFLADDGYSGTNFERPSWKQVIDMIEKDEVETLIVKDLSRLGREYLQVGYYTEIYFPQKGVRFIAVNDGVDSLVASSTDFNPIRPATHAFREGTIEEKNAMIAKDPTYGHIICRCEGVSEGEILAAIRQNPRPRDLDGVKRRTRAQMGRCQGGFCSPYIVELLAQEMNIPYEDVTKCGGKSRINVQKTKGGAL